MTALEQITSHHLLPQSRGGGKKDILKIAWVYHKAYHYLFGNLTSDEAIKFLILLFSINQKNWSKTEYYSEQIKLQGFVEKRKNNPSSEGEKLFKVYFKPVERGGLSKNFIMLPYYPKISYYNLFGNLSTREAIFLLKEVFSEKGQRTIWTPEKIYSIRQRIMTDIKFKKRKDEKKYKFFLN